MTFIKKTDKIILFPFIRLFVLVLSVTVFIMLMQFFLIWFDEFIGKDLGLWIYLQLFLYFGINATPVAFSLATLVASLMVFGNLGEQLELTALKSAGIPFIRILRPLLLVVGLLSAFVYFSNGYLVPKVTVKAHTLLYDLRKKKPSVAIKEGVFYNGLPDYSIRVGRKLPDQKSLEDIIIYDHTNNKGNVHMTAAASGQLTNSPDGRYLIIELFNGYNYLEQQPNKDNKKTTTTPDQPTILDFYRTNFKAQKVLIDLDSFKLTRTSEKYFTYYHSTKTTRELIKDIVEMKGKIKDTQQVVINSMQQHYKLPSPAHTASPDSATDTLSTSTTNGTSTPATVENSSNPIATQEESSTHSVESISTPNATEAHNASTLPDSADYSIRPIQPEVSSSHLLIQDLARRPDRQEIIQKTLRQARDFKYQIESDVNQLVTVNRELKEFQLEEGKRTAYAIACLIMLLIGASLGSLIKKGGLGIPLLISTVFILLYYVVDIFGTKWTKIGLISPTLGAWGANLVLIPFALFFLWQAQKDTRLLDRDAYRIRWRRTNKRTLDAN